MIIDQQPTTAWPHISRWRRGMGGYQGRIRCKSDSMQVTPRIYSQGLLLKIGLTVYQAIAGKNMMGTPRPGNSSGDLISNGNDIEIGIITIANETMDNIKLKMISPFFLKNLIQA